MKTILLITLALTLTACGKHDPKESGCDEPYFSLDCVKSCSLYMRDRIHKDGEVWRYYYSSRDLCGMNGDFISRVDRGYYVEVNQYEHTLEQ